jgi:hypothetical protein
MAWLITATLMLAPNPAMVAWSPPSLPGLEMPAPGSKDPVRWQRRRRKLTRTVAVFGTMTGAGALLLILPMTLSQDDEDGTGIFPVIATGAALFTFGGAGTTSSAPFLGHHLRWDHPSYLARTAPPHAAHRSRRHTRRLFTALGIEGGFVMAGGLAVGMGFVAALTCPDDQDLDCTNPRINAGGIPGFTMIGLGSLAMVSTGILIGLQKRHGHTEGSGPRVTGLSPGGVTIRF